MSASTVQFWFDFASTYSYPAAMRLEAEAKARGVDVVWRAILLGPIFAAQGLKDAPFRVFPQKGRYMQRDLERICAALHLPFQLPAPFPQNSLLCGRIAHALDGEARVRFVKSVYALEFGEGRTISDPLIAAEALCRADLDPSFVEKAKEDEVKAALRAATEEAQSAGVFGAPAFTTKDGELFWGNDRLEDALNWAVQGKL